MHARPNTTLPATATQSRARYPDQVKRNELTMNKTHPMRCDEGTGPAYGS